MQTAFHRQDLLDAIHLKLVSKLYMIWGFENPPGTRLVHYKYVPVIKMVMSLLVPDNHFILCFGGQSPTVGGGAILGCHFHISCQSYRRK